MPLAQSAQNIYAVLQDLNEEHVDDEAVECEVEDSNQDFEYRRRLSTSLC
jgi:hypothetical protein